MVIINWFININRYKFTVLLWKKWEMENTNTANLYYYIKYWLFIKNFEENNPFDLIIFEDFENKEISFSPKVNIKTMKDYWYDFSASWFLSAQTKWYQNILVIIDNLNVSYLLPFIKWNLDKNFTIINLWTGISSFINKPIPELDDISTLTNYDINVYEPYDVNIFFKMLNNRWRNYIRIANKELPIDLMWTEWWDLNDGSITLTENMITWDNWTLIIPAYMLPECLLTIETLQKDWNHYDGFLIYDYNFELNNEIQESIKKTENLIVILDQTNSNYENKIKAMLWDKWLFDSQIKFIYPDVKAVTTNLADFIFQQWKFDWHGIYDAIITS